MKKIEKVSIIGMGALGIMYGKFIADAIGFESVTFIADKNRINRYRKEKVYCNDIECNFNLPSDCENNSPADLLIFAVKATSLDDALSLVKNHVDEDTVILSLLNGVTSEEIIGEALGYEKVIHSVAQGMDPVIKGNRLTFNKIGQICVGILKGEGYKKELLDRVIEFFDDVQLPYTLENDIKHRIWSKWMLNVGVNQVVMINEGNYETIQREGKAREMMIAAMREAMVLAEKEGANLTEDDLTGYLNLLDTLNPKGMPSMRRDGIMKRPSEVELFSGTVIRKSKERCIEVPVNSYLYDKIKEIEKGYN